MRHLVVSSDCHAGLPPERYRDYLDPKYRARFDLEIAAQIAQRKEAAKLFLVDEFNERWRAENWSGLTGAWDHKSRIDVLGGNAVRFYKLDAEKLAPIAARIGPEQGAFE